MASTADFFPAPARRLHAAGLASPGGTIAVLCWQDAEAIVSDWDALALDASEPNPFFESWYLLPALRAFAGRHDVRAVQYTVNGQLAGLMPIARSRRYYHLPLPNLSTWVHANCFLGAPLVARGHERAFWRALLGWADTNAGFALFLHVPHIPLDGPLHAALADVLHEQGRESALVLREERAMLSSPLDAETYLTQALSAKKRKELRRQFNRLSDEGEITVERYRDAARLGQWTEDFLALEHDGWKGKAGSALRCDPGTEALFREALTGAARRGRAERLTLALDGKPIAMLATFLTPPGAYSFKTTFDDRYARFSPGVLLQRENLAILGERDIVWTDSCASADHPMIDHLWSERRTIGRVSIAIGGKARRALFKRIAKAELSRKANTGIDAGLDR